MADASPLAIMANEQGLSLDFCNFIAEVDGTRKADEITIRVANVLKVTHASHAFA